MALAKNLYGSWMRACARGKIEIMEDMAAGDPWPDLVCSTPQTSCLILAASNGHEEICRRLLAHRPCLEICNEDQQTPLIVAAQENHKAIASMLVEAGSNVGAVDADGKTALFHAARNGNTDLVALLAPRTPRELIDTVAHNGSTALGAGCHAIDARVMTALLECGADPNHFDKIEQERVLQSALLLNNAGAAQELIKYGAKLTHLHNGDTYLHTAVRQECEETLRVLLDAGCNQARKNKDGLSARELASQAGWIEFGEITAQWEAEQLQARTPNRQIKARAARL